MGIEERHGKKQLTKELRKGMGRNNRQVNRKKACEGTTGEKA
jgi:hypothetical protein